MGNKKYPLRRDALISPWGVGAIIPFPNDESLMVARLDDWFKDNDAIDEFKIEDERLSKRLGGKLLVAPPDYREKSSDTRFDYIKIPAVRFPLWHYCPVCGNMEKLGQNSQSRKCSGEIRRSNGKDTYCFKNIKKPNKLPTLIPERFIAVCKHGHIEDFPIMEWVHQKCGHPILPSCKLYRSTGGNSASLAGVRYTCTCGGSATMNGAFGTKGLESIEYKCKGNRPWLGQDANENCGDALMVLQRGASNVWFADIISSVYIPPNACRHMNPNTKDVVDKGIQRFASSRKNCDIDFDGIQNFVNLYKKIYDDLEEKIVYEEIVNTLRSSEKKDLPETDLDYRKEEFDVLTRSVGEPDDELYTKNYPTSFYKDLEFLNSITMVHKLRETRVFCGFRRISPKEGDLAPISYDEVNWLPAIKNSGEGIMFEFDQEKIKNWAINREVNKRVKIIEKNMKDTGRFTDERLNPVYVMLHTFAHCLILALSNESGYSNSSIRERVYCDKYILKESHPMAGILIYTASGDSEGSLGGLVRQGLPDKIKNIIKRAIDEASWCSSDPVCIQSSGQGLFGSNLSACHNCALLPETSCEDKNMFLDRALLIGTLDEEGSGIGYFTDYYEKD